jgi:membrane-associated protein
MGPQVEQIDLIKKRQESFNKGTRILKKFGPFAIFIGRFIPAIRSIIPALLGVTKFEKIKFTLLDTLACSLWSVALAAIIFGIDNLI